MKPKNWNELADRICAKLEGSTDPLEIMLKATWEHSKISPLLPDGASDEQWDRLVKSDVVAQVEALTAAGFRIVKA